MSGLAKVTIEALLADQPPRTNFNLFWVDGRYTLRVARVRGAYPWHRHPDHDEAWFVVQGRVRIRTDTGACELSAGEAVLVPKGLHHSPEALEDLSTVLIVNGRDFVTAYDEGASDETAGYREFDHLPAPNNAEAGRHSDGA